MSDFRESQNVLLVGCGKMGGALLRGWLQKGLLLENVLVIEPSGKVLSEGCDDVAVVSSVDDLADGYRPDVIVLAVKPQMFPDVLPCYSHFSDAVFLSIAAGPSLAKMANLLGDDKAIVRAMPNIPALIGRGMSAFISGNRVSDDQEEVCASLLAAAGEVCRLSDEGQMDAVTAISGSGPAYVFHFVEALAEAGRELGLPLDMARLLARETVVGSAAVMGESKDVSEKKLREQVTSPGGTTQAGLSVLMAENEGLGDLLQRTTLAAKSRSIELNK